MQTKRIQSGLKKHQNSCNWYPMGPTSALKSNKTCKRHPKGFQEHAEGIDTSHTKGNRNWSPKHPQTYEHKQKHIPKTPIRQSTSTHKASTEESKVHKQLSRRPQHKIPKARNKIRILIVGLAFPHLYDEYKNVETWAGQFLVNLRRKLCTAFLFLVGRE